ncbi:CHC2 zinc finger domain-containing protein [Brachyspira hyodysenteriae]|uniref:CHC2 zinc finger domain-containing protein n=1 Tax=Brachyspira hyodysenteriae TaxID=159 RepID=UPI0022CE1FD5|nr:CHC2 zinc finger domain-containing protein [Brachyspira hyodysenteriae]MDA0027765.1 CHC2 zinc finger domain-containing protein [Brachyspira hyodysenteriae]
MNDINNIKRNYSIIDIAKRLGFEIDRNNKSICPFHNDTNPSLSFNIKDNYYHCFSCGASGDNIKLVKEVLHCSFNEAINFITGNNYQYTNKSNIKKEITNDKVNIDYSNIYKTFIDLLNNEEALKYLEKRCISKNQVIEHKNKKYT